MSKKNERYTYKRQHKRNTKYDKNILEGVDCIKGQEVPMKQKFQNMSKKTLKTRPKQAQFPTIKKVTKRETLANIRIRILLLKYAYRWEEKTFGKVSPYKARQHYKRKLLKRSFQQWEDTWWNGRNEWKLNIRADYHNRFRLWLKIWRSWRLFLVLQKIKKRKVEFVKQKADRALLAKSLADWKSYLCERRKKKVYFAQAHKDGKIVIKRMAFSKWKTCFKFQQDIHINEEQALHFWARNLLCKAWRCWWLKYSAVLEEKQKTMFAVQLYNRRIALKMLCYLRLYCIQRKSKKLKLLGVRFHHLRKLRHVFLKWKLAWHRKVQLMEFEDTVHCKANRARKQRMLIHWKHYIILHRYEREIEYKAYHHYEIKLKLKCIKVLQNRVLIQKRTAAFKTTARRFHEFSLLRRAWKSWLRRCEDRDDLRQISLFNFVKNHYRKRLLGKVFKSWTAYCEWKRFRHDQNLKADIMARYNLLPRYLTRWEVFVDLVKSRRENQKRSEEFRRECLLAKTFYHWVQDYHLFLDVRMLHRMAILSYDEKLKKEYFQVWITKTRERLIENSLLERGQDHYQLQLKKNCFVAWREHVKYLNYNSVRLNMALQYQNKKLLTICWINWSKFVMKKREKWKKIIKADLHFRQGILEKTMQAWKAYYGRAKEIKVMADVRKSVYDRETQRCLFDRWRTNARSSKISKENDHISNQQWKMKLTQKAFSSWRVYAEERLLRKHQNFLKIAAARKELDQSKLRRTLLQWKKEYVLRVSTTEKTIRAIEHWRKSLLSKAIDALKKYRFLGYRKQVLRQQCMLYHNDRIIASHWKIWRFRYADCVSLLKKSHMALWLWGFTLQQKTFVSWFRFVEKKRKKKVAIDEALRRRRQWLQKVAVTRWIEFATYFISERERFAASRHVEFSQNVQRSVQRCAIHWRRKTEKNRGKRRQVASLERPLSIKSYIASHSTIESKSKGSVSANITKRPQPRVPDYLRESFNLSDLSEHNSVPVVSTEDFPRNLEGFPRNMEHISPASEAVPRSLPFKLQPLTQHDHPPKPSLCASSITSSDASQIVARKEILSSVNHSKKVSPHRLLPPSSFLKTKKAVNNFSEKQISQGNGKDEKVGDRILVGSQTANANLSSADTRPDGIPSFLSDKNSQQSIVQLRNRMLKYYTVGAQLRGLHRRLNAMRQWSLSSSLNAEELSVITELISELSENVVSTSGSLEQSYKIITDDLDALLERVS